MARTHHKKQPTQAQEGEDDSCRLDKWLWAARFFKTRSLAAEAVDSGKVRVDGDRAKNAKVMKPGMRVSIKNKDMQIEVEVLALSNARRGAPEAALLYRETEESVQLRLQVKGTGADLFALRERGAGRPTKRQMRDIQRFTGRE
ncbi:RNA-binding S4 domain-containing protein [Methylophilus aquaticus]|uniref:RNA-binding S4 domain-containing protein n=1 Tax=Methylophilus aquaticus TaxID=1971610 RepID=A0ABT9JT12_9PROT|nr:RNA-binding S4 domain-containing protein [Methylophilus aquaticus]MDP8567721.1 RNA-binding S4 domain-containing protein [Methylophilus aquaticus]